MSARPRPPRPTFLLVGAPRAATTAIHHWLGRHPDVCVSRPKETQFFSLHYDRGLAYYEACFAHHAGEAVVGESTPMYLALPYVPRRIAAALPGVRLLAVLREPVAQAHSTWWMLRCLGAERRSFEDAVAAELEAEPMDAAAAWMWWADLLEASQQGRPVDTARYLMIGEYATAVRRYLRHVDRSQLTVLLHDDVVADPAAAMDRVAAAVGVDPGRAATRTPPRVNGATGRIEAWVQRRVRRVPSVRLRQATEGVAARLDRRARPPLAPSTRRDLARYFAERNAGLDDLTGVDVSHWYPRTGVAS